MRKLRRLIHLIVPGVPRMVNFAGKTGADVPGEEAAYSQDHTGEASGSVTATVGA